jgi:hypothetical protein
MKFLSIFFRKQSDPLSAKLDAFQKGQYVVHWGGQGEAYWRGQYEQAQSTANARLDALIAIRNYTANQKSGTARKVHRMTLGGAS